MPDTPRDILLTPGPTNVPQPVLDAMALPIIHHRTKQFQGIFAELSQALQRLFGTSGPVLSIAGSGTTAFESAQVCLAKPHTPVITIAGGKFGERWQDVYDTYAPVLNITNVKLSHAWGTGCPLDQLTETLKKHPNASVVTVVHSETSTCSRSDVQQIAKAVKQHAPEALLVVDGITSVGAFACPMDEWGIDVLVTGSQKALMLPPGIGFVGLNSRALNRLNEIKFPLPAYNLDLRKWVKSHAKNDVPFTPPVSLIRAQLVALQMIEKEGLDNVFNRTAELASITMDRLTGIGLRPISSSPAPSVSGFFYPEGVDDSKFRAALRDKHGIHITGGQDGRGASWKGKIFRVSHMGAVDRAMTEAGLTAIEHELSAVASA